MAVIPTPQLTPRTALWGLGFRFERIGLDFQNLYYDVREVWLIGKWLGYPFWVFGWGMLQARDNCWDTDNQLVKIQSWINHLVDGWGIIEIIETLSYNLRQVINNPRQFVRTFVEQLSFDFRMLVLDANLWFRAKFNTNYPDLFSIVRNPYQWLRDRIYDTWPGLVTFFISPTSTVLGWIRYNYPFISDLMNNPSGKILDWIEQRYPWFYYLMTNPTNFVINRIKLYSWQLGVFIDDPRQWFIARLSDILGIPEIDFNDFPRAIFRIVRDLILSSFGSFQEEIEDSIISIILIFI